MLALYYCYQLVITVVIKKKIYICAEIMVSSLGAKHEDEKLLSCTDHKVPADLLFLKKMTFNDFLNWNLTTSY